MLTLDVKPALHVHTEDVHPEICSRRDKVHGRRVVLPTREELGMRCSAGDVSQHDLKQLHILVLSKTLYAAPLGQWPQSQAKQRSNISPPQRNEKVFTVDSVKLSGMEARAFAAEGFPNLQEGNAHTSPRELHTSTSPSLSNCHAFREQMLPLPHSPGALLFSTKKQRNNYLSRF